MSNVDPTVTTRLAGLTGPTVVVVGGGIVGAATAWQLARGGAKVVLVEQFAPGHDLGSSHGSSRIFRLAYPDATYVELATQALDLWRSLESITGSDILTLTGGVDHGPLHALHDLKSALDAAGHRSTLLTPTEASRRWPGLRFETAVLHHSEAGRTDADVALHALHAAAATAGAEIRLHTRVERIAPSRDHALVTLRGGSTITADRVVIAAGGWLPALFADHFPGLPPLRVTQEQPIHLGAATPARWPSFIHHIGGELAEGEGVYGLGSVRGATGVKIGHHGVGPLVDPAREPGTDGARDRSIDLAAVNRLIDYARRWLPGVDTDVASATTCLYTSTPDGEFVIDEVGPLVLASACSGHGFKHAPAVGQLVARITLGEVSVPERFALARFAVAR